MIGMRKMFVLMLVLMALAALFSHDDPPEHHTTMHQRWSQ